MVVILLHRTLFFGSVVEFLQLYVQIATGDSQNKCDYLFPYAGDRVCGMGRVRIAQS